MVLSEIPDGECRIDFPNPSVINAGQPSPSGPSRASTFSLIVPC
jgi:hypothetical protein